MDYFMKRIKNLYIKLLVCAAVGILTTVLYLTGIGCVWRYLFNIRCPGCGMTSAYIALMQLDIYGAFKCHPMFWSIPVILCYILYDGRPIQNKHVNNAVIACIGAGFIISYFISG